MVDTSATQAERIVAGQRAALAATRRYTTPRDGPSRLPMGSHDGSQRSPRAPTTKAPDQRLR